MTDIDVLITLHKGYGLGDAVQVSAVLRHVADYRKHWRIDYAAEEGFHQVGRGIVRETFALGTEYPRRYDAEVQICLYDTWANWHDRPNTRVTAALHNTFDIPWKPELARYRVDVRPESVESARTLLYGWYGARKGGKRQGNYAREGADYVAVHYQGDSSTNKKNLSNDEAERICMTVERLGREPLVLDWRNKSRRQHRCAFA